MDLAGELRRRIGHGGMECAREGYRLTALPLVDAPGQLVFTVCEARPHGWWPIVTGRVEARGTVVLTRVERPATPATAAMFLELLLTNTPVVEGEVRSVAEPEAPPAVADWRVTAVPPPDVSSEGWAG